jgi:phage terminase large subunit-like protein
MAGRGFGKTRVGAEWVREQVHHFQHVNIIGPTADDARDVMVEGESGILSICRDDERPRYLKGERKLRWPTGAETLIFTADEPERLRGKQHQKLWADEGAAWRYSEEAWTQAMLGLRLPPEPSVLLTTTPRPIKLVRDLLADDTCAVTTGTTYDNRANLAPSFYEHIIKLYEGTRLGLQELEARLLDDNPDALWQRHKIDELRVRKAPKLKRIVVGVDPQAETTGAETGIVVAGLGMDGHGYVLGDYSLRSTPAEWAAKVVAAYNEFGADRIVAEVNQGGAMVEHTVRTADKSVAYKGVRAARGKATRAEPISALYEQGRVHHVGAFGKLEDQMCQWTPGDDSPDRMDALVWALTELMIDTKKVGAWAW